ncbi:Threonine/homoserine/homoserine lactone efflux protein [Amphritea atlantica]|uniref:Threonine/homoserine/homoserine lactone efflux protein n=1 Tax=Amphritea atlantica TaxID=355243 RepID=A0A1H9CQ63_9GAMM|nr:LysE family translocator [Amphritea atlantica]SEQ03366.1 Threonine/homoserine/homoserine lactone efflux protein [Amphritea atlantica]
MTLDTWLLYCSAALLVILIPGPLSLLMMANSLNFGIRRSYPAFLGGVSASLILLIASATGLGALLLASEQLFTLLRYCGAAYLIWLGYRAWRDAGQASGRNETTNNSGRGVMFRRAFTLGISNPKDILFFVAFLPQFMTQESPLLTQLLIMSVSWCVLDLISKLGYGLAARVLAPALKKQRNIRHFNRVCGGLFISAGSLVFIR